MTSNIPSSHLQPTATAPENKHCCSYNHSVTSNASSWSRELALIVPADLLEAYKQTEAESAPTRFRKILTILPRF